MRRPLQRLCSALALAAAPAAAIAADAEQVFNPGGSPATGLSTAAASGGGFGAVTVLGVLVLAAGGAWLLLRGRKLNFPGRGVRRLAVEETRSLGSRQYLVVASYEGRKFLLGVCPGRIDLLAPLDPSPSREPSP